jgi:hypothetical protein
MGIGYRKSCRESFKELKILTLSSQYIFSLLLFVVHYMGYFASNSVYHNINTRPKNDLHLPHVSLSMYEKGVFYFGIKFFNALPTTVKDISSNLKKFKVTLEHYLLSHSFNSLDEFFSKQSAQLMLCLLLNYIVQLLNSIVLIISVVIYLLHHSS